MAVQLIRTVLASAFLVALLTGSPLVRAACGSSCQCAPGERCDVGGLCQAADKVVSPAAHPLCCSDPDCAPNWLVCENLDGSIGTCGAPGCKPHDCVSAQTECGVIPDGCGGQVDCGVCPGGAPCENGICGGGCTPDCAGKSCGDDGCGAACGECQPGYVCTAGGSCQLCAGDCAGKSCGDDGCGGSCGNCPPGLSCSDAFVCDICQPDCSGKECGDNGCGGSCGSCPQELFCSPDGLCVSCLTDCSGKQCGDDGCGGLCGTCAFTEICNVDGQCLCAPDCLDKECGDNGCGGSCGSCGTSDVCSEWSVCVPQRTQEDVVMAPDMSVAPEVRAEAIPEPVPLDDGSGEGDQTALECPPGTHAVWGACVKDAEETGGSDGGCRAGSQAGLSGLSLLMMLLSALALWRRRGLNMRSVPIFLMVLAMVSGGCSETQVVGTGDDASAIDARLDGVPPGDIPSMTTKDTACVPSCAAKECGDDGCGGQCGSCAGGVACEQGLCAGTCVDECSPAGTLACAAQGIQECGQFDGDGCLEWSEARPCPGFGHCEAGECVCVPDCGGKECGYDGCSGSCGICPRGQQCVDFQCQGGCVDECPKAGDSHCTDTGRVVCGDDDEDGCLEWSEEQSCQGPCVDGECLCQPDCTGKECGPDGCGEKCGTCPPGQACKDNLCTTEGTDCMPGAVDEQNCGNCGKRNRKCGADGSWGEWTDCLSEGVCKSGGQEEKACGKCGVQTRTCLADCQWGNWSYCVGEGLCAPGETQFEACGLCGKQSRSCDSQCNWSSWTGCVGEGICTPGDEKVESCGNCGSRTRKCSPECQWAGWGDCLNQGQCAPGSTGVCGACGWQTCSQTCQWGPCAGEGECVPGTTSTQGCPDCRARLCNNNCTWAPACAACAGCTQFNKCGTTCPSGYHATGYSCNFSCGSCSWNDNQATCVPSCGNQFNQCGTSCPSGYHATGYSCNFSCGSCSWNDNQATCQLTN